MKRKGFTLIELLVVIAIIGLLSTLAVVALTGARAKARDARRLSDVKQIQTALDLFYSDTSSYPTYNATATLGEFTFGEPFKNSDGTVTYMGLVPTNPEPFDGGAAYYYLQTTGGASYYITYYIGNDTGDVKKGAHCATPAGIVDDGGTLCP